MKLIKTVFPLLLCFLMQNPAWADQPKDTFNQLVSLKAEIEAHHGIKQLECFPFLKAIGDNKTQAQWVEKCLTGAQALAGALKEYPEAGLREVGISNRFMRTGGFHTLLVKWDATPDAMVAALRGRPSPNEQEELLSRVGQLKRTIMKNFSFAELYCSKAISNDQCLQGYETLATVSPNDKLSKKGWGAVVLSDTLIPGDDPTALLLRHDQSAEEMKSRLMNVTAQEFWDQRRRVYEEMKTRFGRAFERLLRAPNVFCTTDLTGDECLKGAETLHTMSSRLADRPWGKIWISRHNTLIKSDYDAVLKFDLPVEKTIEYFSTKPSRDEVEKNVTRWEWLEKTTKNNSTGLRAVCDLTGLGSKLCVDGFEAFVKFLKAHPDVKAGPPWETLMFIDGTQLDRVNFALNSKSRHTYLYVNVRSGFEEIAHFLSRMHSS